MEIKTEYIKGKCKAIATNSKTKTEYSAEGKNEKAPLVNPTDRNIGFNNALDVLLDWAEKHYWYRVDNHKDLILLHLKAFNNYHQKIVS